MAKEAAKYNTVYRGERLNRVAFPLGGIGAGMICLEGTGALSHVSLRHKPEVFNEPLMLAALFVKGAKTARVLEGPVPKWKAFGTAGAGNGSGGKTYGLPRFADVAFTARFPFATVSLTDPSMPLRVELTGWSPFTPGQADDSSLPVAALEYRFINRTAKSIAAVFSFHASNFMKTGDQSGGAVEPIGGGFVLTQPAMPDRPWDEGHFAVLTTDVKAQADCGWFRGGWFDALTMIWNAIAAGQVLARGPHRQGGPGNGGSLYVPFTLKPKAEKTIRVLLAWHVPSSNLRQGAEPEQQAPSDCGPNCACGEKQKSPAAVYQPWYAAKFPSLAAVVNHWHQRYDRLRAASRTFSDCFYDTTLPPEVVEAVAANLTILKSPTCLRQADGRLWCWEGCGDSSGCCEGTCSHVWNYAQALPHLFPALERGLRETEFLVNQDQQGHQNFRGSLPIRPPAHNFHAAADGQLGGLLKLYRDWRISGDTAWMRSLWPAARRSLEFCIRTWDPDHTGTLIEPHHNTYDIEFWGADGMCTSIYLGALQAAIGMARECGDGVGLFEQLLANGRAAMETTLWNGEYFVQKTQWAGLRAGEPTTAQAWNVSYTPEARAIVQNEGPKYQYGTGCLSDGVLGDWLARCCGVAPVLDSRKVARHATAVFKHNFRDDLSAHANPQRPSYAFGKEAGLLLCTWPRGGRLSLPFFYSDEVWTGIEYAVASHLMMTGHVPEALRIVRATRDRYDGRCRNPFNEYECGHWYARAMASYALLQSLTGARYDAVTRTLYLEPKVKGDFRAFLATATGFGTVGLKKGRPFCQVVAGTIPIDRFDCRLCNGRDGGGTGCPAQSHYGSRRTR